VLHLLVLNPVPSAVTLKQAMRTIISKACAFFHWKAAALRKWRN
jgi:hypothetical protein